MDTAPVGSYTRLSLETILYVGYVVVVCCRMPLVWLLCSHRGKSDRLALMSLVILFDWLMTIRVNARILRDRTWGKWAMEMMSREWKLRRWYLCLHQCVHYQDVCKWMGLCDIRNTCFWIKLWLTWEKQAVDDMRRPRHLIALTTGQKIWLVLIDIWLEWFRDLLVVHKAFKENTFSEWLQSIKGVWMQFIDRRQPSILMMKRW